MREHHMKNIITNAVQNKQYIVYKLVPMYRCLFKDNFMYFYAYDFPIWNFNNIKVNKNVTSNFHIAFHFNLERCQLEIRD